MPTLNGKRYSYDKKSPSYKKYLQALKKKRKEAYGDQSSGE